MKRFKLSWKRNGQMKAVELDKESILVAEHKGDISYKRYVRFKQLAPQFWERMDSPLLEPYLERIDDAFNKSEWMKGRLILNDYKLAISQMNQDHDAWGLCFALISYEKGETLETPLNDVELREKLDRMASAGLTPDIIKDCVVNFMKASPETFQDHLILLEVQNMMSETEK